MIATEQAAEFCDLLNDYLMARYGYKTKLAKLMPGLRIHVSRSHVHLYARLRPNTAIWGEDTLVIAKLGFKEIGKGNGTSFLKFLAASAPVLGMKHIGIEQAQTLPMINFVQKYNFEQVYVVSNWKISLDNLSLILNSDLISST
ncbi:MAG: hypothetical protein Q7J24_03605 [Desulfomicrobium sp.]|nr:hypothetical protein [Desulfomicrobium sp.]